MTPHNAPNSSITTWCCTSPVAARCKARRSEASEGRFGRGFFSIRPRPRSHVDTYVKAGALGGQTKQRKRARPHQRARERHGERLARKK
eukprot:scaffold47_cov334-Pavlova_lutheri.AAC.64